MIHIDQLQPCPFCGGEAKVVSDNGGEQTYWSVLCKQCQTCIGYDYWSEDCATEAWNTRTRYAEQNFSYALACIADWKATVEEMREFAATTLKRMGHDAG